MDTPLISGVDEEAIVDSNFLNLMAAKRKSPVELSWSGISFSVGDKKILRNVTGKAIPGELFALMGPSGAGKTSLLNILAGRLKSSGNSFVSGNVYLDGALINPADFRSRIAYVMQQDALFATQTPREALRFSAALRLNSVSEKDRNALVESMIHELGLSKCADTMIGSNLIAGISGGEKKRTAIGIELISKPDILFLDEPTSGLDSYSAFVVVKILRKLAHSGCTVICTIHQPGSEIFDLFDHTYILSNGRPVFGGLSSEMIQWFSKNQLVCPEHYNPADFVMFSIQTVATDKLEGICDAWEQEVTNRNSNNVNTPNGEGSIQRSASEVLRETKNMKDKAGFGKQLGYLTIREMRNVIRDVRALMARFGGGIFLNLIVGIVFKGSGGDWGSSPQEIAETQVAIQNHFGALTQLAIGGLFGLAQPMLLAFPSEKPVFLREYATGTYGAIPYFFSKIIVEVPMAIIQSLTIFLVAYWLMGLEGNFMLEMLTVALLGLVAASTSLIISASSPSTEVAIQLSPILFIPQILFSGVFIRTSFIPSYLRWAQYLCSLKYALNLLMIIEFKNPPEGYHDYIYGDNAFFESNDVNPNSGIIYFALLLGVFLGFRLAACGVLAIKGRNLS